MLDQRDLRDQHSTRLFAVAILRSPTRLHLRTIAYGCLLLASAMVPMLFNTNLFGAGKPSYTSVVKATGGEGQAHSHAMVDSKHTSSDDDSGTSGYDPEDGTGGSSSSAGNEQMEKNRQISQAVLAATGGPIMISNSTNSSTLGGDPGFLHLAQQWVLKKRYDPGILSRVLEYKPTLDRFFGVQEDSPLFGQPYNTCAVIGNSGILLGSKMGQLIDAHDMVVRINHARPSKMEMLVDVGLKTTISFINSNILAKCHRSNECRCYPYSDPAPMMVVMCQLRHFAVFEECQIRSTNAPLLQTDPRIDILSQKLVNYYSVKLHLDAKLDPSVWRQRHLEGLRFSTGFEAVILSLGMCRHVSLFGFGKAKGAAHHWHSEQKAELGEHHYEAEYAFYEELVNNKDVPYIDVTDFRLPKVTRMV